MCLSLVLLLHQLEMPRVLHLRVSGVVVKVYGFDCRYIYSRSHKKLYNGFLIRIYSRLYDASILCFSSRNSDNTDECIQRRYDMRETTKRQKSAKGEKFTQLRNGIKFFRHTICLVIGYRSPFSLPLWRTMGMLNVCILTFHESEEFFRAFPV